MYLYFSCYHCKTQWVLKRFRHYLFSLVEFGVSQVPLMVVYAFIAPRISEHCCWMQHEHVIGRILSITSSCLKGNIPPIISSWETDNTTHTPAPAALARLPAEPSERVVMAAGLSWFPMVQCFYEQLEAIMEMRVLNRVKQSFPSDDRPLSLSPLPSQRKLNTNGSITHTFSLHALICTCIHTQNIHSTTLPWTPCPYVLQAAMQCPGVFHTWLKWRYTVCFTNEFHGFLAQIAEICTLKMW